jgi:hypothetical protein
MGSSTLLASQLSLAERAQKSRGKLPVHRSCLLEVLAPGSSFQRWDIPLSRDGAADAHPFCLFRKLALETKSQGEH